MIIVLIIVGVIVLAGAGKYFNIFSVCGGKMHKEKKIASKRRLRGALMLS